MEPGDPTEPGGEDLTVRHVPASGLRLRAQSDGSRLEPGAHVDRYHVIGLLGRGGMGEVYRGYDPELDRQLAIKLIRTPGPNEEGARALLREARALARLSHPNVVTIYDVGTHDGEVWLAMELVDGVDLATWSTKPRSLAEIRDVFAAAARGLAAAHDAGLVHRDFKPANVFIGHEGRVRVGDFGLARAGPLETTTPAAELVGRGLDSGLTGTGVVAGTPSYMAPEVHRGATADARADQYAFCVAYFEALFGARPFVADDLFDLVAAKADGLRTLPSTRPLPAWLRRLLLRGLSPDPAARHPSMLAIVAELERHSGRRRLRNGALLAGVATVLGIGIGTLGARESVVDRCAHADALVDTAWTDERRRAVDEALRSGGTAHGEETASRVVDTLDRYVADWRAAYRTHCEASPAVGVAPWQTLDPHARCLRHRLFVVDALVQSLAEGAEGSSSVAVTAVAELATPASCAEQALASDRTEPPGDLLDRVEDVRAELDRVEALDAIARHEDATVVLDGVADEVESLAFRPLTAEYRFWRGVIESDLQSGEPAERELFAALWEAEASGHDYIAWRAARRVVVTIAVDRREAARARQWAPLAEALAERLGDPVARIQLHDLLGVLHAQLGEYDVSEDHFRDAVELAEADPRNVKLLAHVLGNYGYVYLSRREYLAAEPILRRTDAILRELFGDHHPSVGTSLNQLAAVLERTGRVAEAEVLFEQVLAIFTDCYGETHSTTLHAINNLGTIAMARGDFAEARRLFERALAALDPRLTERAFELAGVQHNLARIAFLEGDVVQAITREREAIDTCGRYNDPQHRVLLPAFLGLATMARQCRADDLARAALERARSLGDWPRDDPAMAVEIELYEALLARESDDPARALTVLDAAARNAATHDDEVTLAMRSELSTLRASVARERGRCAAALVHVEAALADADRAADPEPLRLFAHAERAEIRHCMGAHEDAAADEQVVLRLASATAPTPGSLRAHARFAFARALWERDELAIARTTAEQALALAGGDDESVAIERWLREHEIRCPDQATLADAAREL